MSEILTSPEQRGEITREEVVNAYSVFVKQGIEHPDDLDLEDPEVKMANELFNRWQEQEDARVGGNEELAYRTDLAKTMLFVDAGFTDPDYLDEILSDYLVQMDEDVEKQKDNPERVETRRQIAQAAKKIKKLLKESE